ncbi:MAG: hypothetical protein K9G61_09040, partial [Bacteroidales bacterium]|nr:hypothetical protein [Bacteroidales bacterium]
MKNEMLLSHTEDCFVCLTHQLQTGGSGGKNIDRYLLLKDPPTRPPMSVAVTRMQYYYAVFKNWPAST